MDANLLHGWGTLITAVVTFYGAILGGIRNFSYKLGRPASHYREKEIEQFEEVSDSSVDMTNLASRWRTERAMLIYAKRRLSSSQIDEVLSMNRSALFTREELVLIAKFAGFGSLKRLPCSWLAVVECVQLCLVFVFSMFLLGLAFMRPSPGFWASLILAALALALWFFGLLMGRDGVAYLLNRSKWRERMKLEK